MRLCVIAVVAAFTFALPATAETDERAPSGARPLRYDLKWDLPVTGVALAFWISSATVLKSSLAPPRCRVCGTETDASGNVLDTVNGLDRKVRDAFRWDDGTAAGTWSDISAYAIIPATVIGYEVWAAHDAGEIKDTLLDVLFIAEAVALSGTLTQATKLIVARERPFVHVLEEDNKAKTKQPGDNNLSFYSGHTSFAFSTAVAAGTVARLRGYRFAPVVYGVGLSMAVATGYLRIAADKHYLTDVLVGAAMGSAVGFAVPYFFHSPVAREPDAVRIIPGGSGLAILF